MFNLAGLAGIVFMLVGIIASIALHELGHLWPAKQFRALVPEYMIGFGPKLFQKRIGETVYGFKGILLGGYCKILGMYGPAKPGTKIYRLGWRKLTEEEYLALSPIEQEKVKETLAQSARLASLEEVPMDKLDRAYFNLPVRHKLAIIFGGPIMNLCLSIVLTFVALCGIGVAAPSTQISQVVCYGAETPTSTDSSTQTPITLPCTDPKAKPSPAARAGLQAGDRIVAWDGKTISDWSQVRKYSQETKDSAQLSVQRHGQHLTVEVSDLNGRLGVMAGLEQQRQSPIYAAQLVKEQFVGTAAIVVRLPMAVWDVTKTLFTGQERDKTGVMSIVGASRIAGEVAESGQTTVANRISALIMLLASLNMALFVFNLIPLPPLDGGHIAGALWQGLKQAWARAKGRPVPGPVDAAAAMPLTYAVVCFFIFMTVVLFAADIIKPIRLFG